MPAAYTPRLGESSKGKQNGYGWLLLTRALSLVVCPTPIVPSVTIGFARAPPLTGARSLNLKRSGRAWSACGVGSSLLTMNATALIVQG